MSFLIALSDCGPSWFLRILLFFKECLNIVFIVVPIGLIVMISLDFTKALISADPEKAKKSSDLAMKRLLYAVILFAVPWIVRVFVMLLDGLSPDSVSCLTIMDKDIIDTLSEAEDAVYAAQEEARRKKQKEMLSEEEKIELAESIESINPKVSGCDGVIYYENGTYYKPSSSLIAKNGVAKTKGSAANGYNKYFYEDLTEFVAAAKKAGYTITPSSTAFGSWRSYELQQYYYCCYNGTGAVLTSPDGQSKCTGAKSCNNGNLAAVPGTSNHGWGIASDLSYGGNRSAAVNWAKQNAVKYNLNFSVSSEDWHIEPLSVVTNDEKVKQCL